MPPHPHTATDPATFAAYARLEALLDRAKAHGAVKYDAGPGVKAPPLTNLAPEHPLCKRRKKVVSAYVSRFAAAEYDKLLPQEIAKAEQEAASMRHTKAKMEAENMELAAEIENLRGLLQAQAEASAPNWAESFSAIPPGAGHELNREAGLADSNGTHNGGNRQGGGGDDNGDIVETPVLCFADVFEASEDYNETGRHVGHAKNFCPSSPLSMFSAASTASTPLTPIASPELSEFGEGMELPQSVSPVAASPYPCDRSGEENICSADQKFCSDNERIPNFWDHARLDPHDDSSATQPLRS